MREKDGKIIQATEEELFAIYLERGYDDLFSFDFYKRRCVELGTKIIERDVPTVDIKTEVAREIFAEIKEEIQSALRNNYNVRSKRIEKHGTSDGFISVVDGKILALRGIDDFIDELKNKYIGGVK